MKKQNWNEKWTYILGNQWMALDRKVLDLPHDFVLTLPRDAGNPGGGRVGFSASGQAQYTKVLTVEEPMGTILLDFDGVYERAEVFVGRDLVYQHMYGYTGFTCDMTPFLKPGDNLIEVRCSSIQPASRWYTGGGIYRDVTLYQAAGPWIHPKTVQLTADLTDRTNAVLTASFDLNGGEETQIAILRLLDAEGNEVQWAAAPVNGNARNTVELKGLAPRLWDVEDPYLYTVQIQVGEEIHEETFGFRRIEIDSVNGFRLNGKAMKLRGGCVHHDLGFLGSAAYRAAELRKIKKLKDAGFNALRTAHNPPSENFLKACDEVGMLVLDESFDIWRVGKNPLDYHTEFEKWWKIDTTAMVTRARNHACVYCWSIGNEIMEFDGTANGVYYGKVQADLVRSLDSTRPVTSGINCACGRPETYFEGWDFPTMDHYVNNIENGIFNGEDLWDEATLGNIANLDIAGYNYHFRRYEIDRIKHPERVIQGTETRPALTWENWQAVKTNPNAIGDFVWVAYDNLGEAGMGQVTWSKEIPERLDPVQWPWLSCFQGDLDLTGYRRPISYYRNVVWGTDTGLHLFTRDPKRFGTEPFGNGWHWDEVLPTWTYEECWINRPLAVFAYGDFDKVVFVVNGEVKAEVIPEKMIARADLTYEPGTIEAIGYRNGEAAGTDTLSTTGSAAKLIMETEQVEDLAFIRIRIADASGAPCYQTGHTIKVTTSDPEALLGLGSGMPKTDENFGTGERKTFEGSVIACVKTVPGKKIQVTAVSDTYGTCSIEI